MRISLWLGALGLMACQEAPTITSRKLKDSYIQIGEFTRADLLFVLDNSASMSEEQELLGENFGAFVEVMVDSHADFRVGVVTTDILRPDAGRLLGTILTNSTPDLDETARETFRVGSDGSRDEAGLEAATLALDPALNPDFLRDGARLNIVVFSDEDDYSPLPVADYVGQWRSVVGEAPMSMHAVVGDLPFGCASGKTAADAGGRYIEAAKLTLGFQESICVDDYTEVLTKVGLEAAGLQDTFPLSDVPNPSTLTVLVDDVLMPQREIDGWTYSPGDNAVVFNGRSIPRPGMEIVIEYNPLIGGDLPDLADPTDEATDEG